MQVDDVIFPIRNLKKATGKEQTLHKILQSVVPLDNGEYGYVYRDLGLYKSEKKYMCNVCKRVLIFSKSVFTHNVHHLHKANVKIPMHSSSNFPETTPKIPRHCPTPSDDELDESEPPNSKDEPDVVPGEPVPPGVEEAVSVNDRCQIQLTFDNFNSGPLIGLEYIVELASLEEPDAEPRYICLLCEKKGDPRSVMVHVTSYNHYLKYICCFFRSVGNKLNLIPKTNANRSAIHTAIIKVAEAIEKHFGRLKPIKTHTESFGARKYAILKEIDEKEHFRETPQLTFLDLVTAAKLEEYAKAPVVNYNTRDLDAKNEEMTKKWVKNNQKLASNKAEKKSEKNDKPTKSQEDNGSTCATDGKTNNPDEKKIAIKPDPLASQNPPKKLCIALNKPERIIPGISKTQVQNSDIVIKTENDVVDMVIEDDDCIILPDSKKDPIEINSLSSVSSSRSRSWSRSRYGNNRRRSRSPRQRSARRSRSRDKFGRVRRNSRESSYEKYRRERDYPSRERDRRDNRERRDFDDRNRRDSVERGRRDLDERGRRDMDDRGKRDFDDRSRRSSSDRMRRDYDDRRRRDVDDRGRRDGSRGYRSSSRGRASEGRRDRRYRDDSRGRRGDSRGQRGDSRDRYDDRGRYDDNRKLEDRCYSDRDRRDRMRNPTPERYKDEFSPRRDRHHESESRSHLISDEIKKKNRWFAYKEELVKLEEDLEKTYKFYQGHPEKHPAYNEEWKAFWNKRYKEIQLSGQDPAKYDFKPEWILFWEKKMKEIHEQKVITERETLKRKHNLDDLKDIRDRDLQDVSPPTPDIAKEVTVNDIKKTWKNLTGTDISVPRRDSDREGQRRRSASPWESKSKEKDSDDVGMTSQQFFAPTKRNNSSFSPVPPVIHCLRMLSVLEQQIGFQASKVISLLAEGLAMEKTKPKNSMNLLQNKDVYLFFEAMKEKLRGQLMVGIVQRHLVAATRNVIKTIDSMLQANPLKPEVFEPVTIPGVGEVDKMAVAQKIAGALIKMGKTNVSQEELEQLINAVVGMASASSISADVSSDQFFSQLNIKNSNASSHINSIISSLIQTAQESVSDDPPRNETVVSDIADQREARLVNYDEDSTDDNKDHEERGPSPFSMRVGGTNPIKERYEEKKEDNSNYNDDDDDDDYSFEDVYHAASEKLKKSEDNINPSTGDENSKSSMVSMPPKSVADILNSVDTSALANLGIFNQQSNIQQNVEGSNINHSVEPQPVNESKPLNLNDLKSLLNPSKVSENPSIDMSLVESIKDTLVQSFSQNNAPIHLPETLGSSSVVETRPRERPTLDPRSRSVWDPSIKALDSQKSMGSRGGPGPWMEHGGRPSVWDDQSWDSRPRDNQQQWNTGGRGPWEGNQPGRSWESSYAQPSPDYGQQFYRPPPPQFRPDNHPPFVRPNPPYPPYQDPNMRPPNSFY